LLEDGVPMRVERTLICPPRCRMGAITIDERATVRGRSPVGAKYDTPINRESAYEMLNRRAATAADEDAGAAPPKGRSQTKPRAPASNRIGEMLWGTKRRQGMVETMAKQAARTVGGQLGRQILSCAACWGASWASRAAADRNSGASPLDQGVILKKRCEWCGTDPLYVAYHDEEWGVPVHDDRRLFEMIVLEGAQAGLSWATILKKREAYREVFDGFDPAKVARYTAKKVGKLLTNPGIVRNRLKIESAVRNARAFLEVTEEFGSFDAYIWRFVGGRPVTNTWRHMNELPARTLQSDAMSKDLKRRGFNFVGSTICYAFMQSVGMVNDHVVDCFRYREVDRLVR
jgi:DNA-3-methyladenine glycosylase I